MLRISGHDVLSASIREGTVRHKHDKLWKRGAGASHDPHTRWLSLELERSEEQPRWCLGHQVLGGTWHRLESRTRRSPGPGTPWWAMVWGDHFGDHLAPGNQHLEHIDMYVLNWVCLLAEEVLNTSAFVPNQTEIKIIWDSSSASLTLPLAWFHFRGCC